jgi:hypothetical protein
VRRGWKKEKNITIDRNRIDKIVRGIKKISILILAAAILLICGQTPPVYSGGTEGVLPDAFSDYLTTIFNVFFNNKALPDLPPSTPQNTLTISNSIDQKYYTPPTQGSTSFYNTPEHKTELFIPYRLSPLSKDEPLMPEARPYAVTICLSYNDSTAPGCSDKKTASQASEQLADVILNKYFKGNDIRPFRVVMPQAVPSEEQIRLLRQIETDAISIIETGMMQDLKSLKIFSSETEEGRSQKQNIIIEDVKTARQEAEKGVNWSHSTKEDRSVHTFHEGKAFVQLNQVLISGRVPEKKQ